MIFLSGVHGVGKSYFCQRVNVELGIVTHSASKLIANRKNVNFANDKLIPDIDNNQQYLLAAVNDLNFSSTKYILDGHFCLLNSDGNVSRIPTETFIALHPEAIILLTETPEIIAERRGQRDGIIPDVSAIQHFQDEEMYYANEIAEVLGVPITISSGSNDFEKTLCFLQAIIRRIENG
jgi:adenylate kinase